MLPYERDPQEGETNPRELLVEFLDFTRRLFDTLVSDREQYFQREFGNLLPVVWEELRPLFRQVQDAVRALSDEQLQSAGLYGRQLAFKLTGFRSAWNSFFNLGGVNRLIKVLKWINTLLKSLVSLLPIGEPLVEFKEVMETEIEHPESPA